MLRLSVLAVGKLTDPALVDLTQRYLQRLQPHGTVKIIEVPHGKAATASANQLAEAQALQAKTPPGAVVVMLDERGQNVTTRTLADKLATWRDQGVRDVVFVIGGADGLDPTYRASAPWVWQLSALTFAHQWVRPLLLEQLYRVVTLWSGHPYHRD